MNIYSSHRNLKTLEKVNDHYGNSMPPINIQTSQSSNSLRKKDKSPRGPNPMMHGYNKSPMR